MFTNHRVLVVDDYPDAAEMVCTLLTVLGYDCRGASNGADALALARTFEPDIGIIDIGLPDMTGYDLARELRRVLPGRPLYLTALTGWGTNADRLQSYEAGFDDHLVKPADSTKLREVLHRAELSYRDSAVDPQARA